MKFFPILSAFLCIFKLKIAESLVLGQKCRKFSLGECDFDDTKIVSEFTLPGNPGTFVLCQELCQIEERCNYFTYDSSKSSCILYSAYDIVDCSIVAGPAQPDLFECLPEPGSHTCDDFSKFKCLFNGVAVLIQDDISYPVECQQILKTLGDPLGAEFFVYHRNEKICKLMTPFSEYCYGITGPDFPDFEDECDSITSTTPLIPLFH